MFRLSAGFVHDLANVGGCLHGTAADIQDNVTGLQPAFCRAATRIDFNDYDALIARAGYGACRRQREAKNRWLAWRLLLLCLGLRHGAIHSASP